MILKSNNCICQIKILFYRERHDLMTKNPNENYKEKNSSTIVSNSNVIKRYFHLKDFIYIKILKEGEEISMEVYLVIWKKLIKSPKLRQTISRVKRRKSFQIIFERKKERLKLIRIDFKFMNMISINKNK